MIDEEKGKRFLELIDKQSSLQWGIVSRLSALIKSGWDSASLQGELEDLVTQHEVITKEMNGLDGGSNGGGNPGGSTAL